MPQVKPNSRALRPLGKVTHDHGATISPPAAALKPLQVAAYFASPSARRSRSRSAARRWPRYQPASFGYPTRRATSAGSKPASIIAFSARLRA